MPAPLTSGRRALQIRPERLRIDRRRLDSDLELVRGKTRRVAVGRRRDDQVLGRRQEHARGVLENFLRADAERHVLALRRVQLRDQDFQIGVERRAVERIPVGFGKLAEDRVDRGLARTERILVAADADDVNPGWRGGTLAPLLGFRHVFLVATRGHEFSGRMAPANSQPLKETATRYRHGDSFQRQRPVVDGVKNGWTNLADLTLPV